MSPGPGTGTRPRTGRALRSDRVRFSLPLGGLSAENGVMNNAGFALALSFISFGSPLQAAVPPIPCPADLDSALPALGAERVEPESLEAYFEGPERQEGRLKQIRINGARPHIEVTWEVGQTNSNWVSRFPGADFMDSSELLRSLQERGKLKPAPRTGRPRKEVFDYVWRNELGAGTATRIDDTWVLVVHEGADGKMRSCSASGCRCD